MGYEHIRVEKDITPGDIRRNYHIFPSNSTDDEIWSKADEVINSVGLTFTTNYGVTWLTTEKQNSRKIEHLREVKGRVLLWDLVIVEQVIECVQE